MIAEPLSRRRQTAATVGGRTGARRRGRRPRGDRCAPRRRPRRCRGPAPARAGSCGAGSPRSWSPNGWSSREAAALGVDASLGAPSEADVLPDRHRAPGDRQHRRHRAGRPARPGAVRARHRRCGRRRPTPSPTTTGATPAASPPTEPRWPIATLRGAARRRAFRLWLEQRRAALVWLAPGYEHPGDPRQPDNVHKH